MPGANIESLIPSVLYRRACREVPSSREMQHEVLIVVVSPPGDIRIVDDTFLGQFHREEAKEQVAFDAAAAGTPCWQWQEEEYGRCAALASTKQSNKMARTALRVRDPQVGRRLGGRYEAYVAPLPRMG